MQLEAGTRVKVYWDPHKKKLKVQEPNGKTLCHVNTLVLRDCELVTQPTGRACALREDKKSVHSFIRGYVSENQDFLRDVVKITSQRSFMHGRKKVSRAEAAVFSGKHLYAKGLS